MSATLALDASLPSEHTPFAHASERQFARLLDFYQIEWRYEPTSFDLDWDRDGHVVQRFTPDFYLPEFDLYIEITTLNQKLVTKRWWSLPSPASPWRSTDLRR